MSQENLDLLRRGFEHVSRTGKLSPETVQPDFVWGAFEDWTLDIEQVFDAGDQIVTFVRQHAKARHGGPAVEMRFAQVWSFRDGLIARMEMYSEPADALKAVGLRE